MPYLPARHLRPVFCLRLRLQMCLLLRQLPVMTSSPVRVRCRKAMPAMHLRPALRCWLQRVPLQVSLVLVLIRGLPARKKRVFYTRAFLPGQGNQVEQRSVISECGCSRFLCCLSTLSGFRCVGLGLLLHSLCMLFRLGLRSRHHAV